MKTLIVGNWVINGGILSKKDSSGFADLFEGFGPIEKRNTKKEVKEIFDFCFSKKKCTEQDITDLYTIIGVFLEMERLCTEFRHLEENILSEVYPDIRDPHRFSLCHISEWPIDGHQKEFFGGLIEARCALSEIRGMALERWKNERGEPFPYKSNLDNLSGGIS